MNPERTLAAADRVRMIATGLSPAGASVIDRIDAYAANEELPQQLLTEAISLARRAQQEGDTKTADALRGRLGIPPVA